MRDLYLYRLAFILLACGLVFGGMVLSRRKTVPLFPARWVLTAILSLQIGFVVYLWFNHAGFPLNLDLMEGTVLQEFQRAASFQAVYPAPTPGYVPLAYNPLFYFLAVPFGWIFGANMFALRLTAILGMAGCGIILFFVVRKKTESAWWGFAAVGMFAAAYRVMDAYLDTAHSDSWLLFAVLLGTLLIDRGKSKAVKVLGVLVLVAAFWFKQHGALFAVGGLLFLTWREGIKGSWRYWAAALAAGPAVYLFVGPALFGSHFHYFTFEVPRQWSSFGLQTLKRYFGFIALSYPVLALSGGLSFLGKLWKDRKTMDVWDIQLVFAMLAGLMGALDAGSSNNVFIPMGMWFILTGTVALHRSFAKRGSFARDNGPVFALFVSLAFFLYNPAKVIVSPRAGADFAEFVGILKALDGPVYAPWLGQLERGYSFHPAAHWVALEDMVRGPGLDVRNHPNTRNLLEPALRSGGTAYILGNYPLQKIEVIAFLEESYVLERDFGDRFKSLGVLPKRWDHGWPRYLYRYRKPGSVSE